MGTSYLPKFSYVVVPLRHASKSDDPVDLIKVSKFSTYRYRYALGTILKYGTGTFDFDDDDGAT